MFVVLGLCVANKSARTTILTTLGHGLVVDERIETADVIVVASDTDGAGTLEAADLIHQGVASRVAIFSDPPDGIDAEFNRRGIPWKSGCPIHSGATIPWRYRDRKDSSNSGRNRGRRPRACLTGAICTNVKSIVVVSSRDHSRRLSRVLRRAMKGHSTRVMNRAARYSQFDPDHWWESRGGVRTTIIEYQKLFLDLGTAPFPITTCQPEVSNRQAELQPVRRRSIG